MFLGAKTMAVDSPSIPGPYDSDGMLCVVNYEHVHIKDFLPSLCKDILIRISNGKNFFALRIEAVLPCIKFGAVTNISKQKLLNFVWLACR